MAETQAYDVHVMSTAEISDLARLAKPSCTICGGSGVDEAFGSPCLCTTRVVEAPVVRFARGSRSDVAGRGTKPREAKPEIDPGLIEWLRDQKWSSFAVSLADQFDRSGSLSDKQVAAAVSMREKCARKAPQPCPAPEERPTEAPIDLSDIPAGRYAVPSGETRLKVLIDKPGEDDPKWSGWTFVKDAAVYGSGQSYGSQRPGSVYRGKIQDELREIALDPRAASAAYGRLTGTCGMCGRDLENEESVARGIGPHCAKKAGWL